MVMAISNNNYFTKAKGIFEYMNLRKYWKE